MGRLGSSPPRLRWRTATIKELRAETSHAKTLLLEVPGWPGHLAGQHVDIRLTAQDGYQAQRSYSIASAPENEHLELTVELIPDGEVSMYLVDEARPGDRFELRGPIGGYFTWHEGLEGALVAVGGGSGLVPLMAMVRHRQAVGAKTDARLLLSARTFDDVLYRDELLKLRGAGVAIRLTLTRATEPPADWADAWTRRIDREMLEELGPGAGAAARCYVCGPTPFVEEAARLLVELGHDALSVRTERFGPTGA